MDEGNQVIHHTVLGGLFPNWTGTIQSRYYKFEDDRLVLSTDPIGCIAKERAIVTLVWERIN